MFLKLSLEKMTNVLTEVISYIVRKFPIAYDWLAQGGPDVTET